MLQSFGDIANGSSQWAILTDIGQRNEQYPTAKRPFGKSSIHRQNRMRWKLN